MCLALPAPAGQPRIRIVYVLFGPKQPRPTWPHIGFDFVPVMNRLEAELARQCPGFQFVTSMASTEEEAKKILKEDQAANVDGYLVYQMNNWPRVVQTIATSGKPVLYADFTYAGTGGFLSYNAAFLRTAVTERGFCLLLRIAGPHRGGEMLRDGPPGAIACRVCRGDRAFAATAHAAARQLACTADPVRCLPIPRVCEPAESNRRSSPFVTRNPARPPRSWASRLCMCRSPN